MMLLDIEKLLDMIYYMLVYIFIELIIFWEQSEEVWSVKDNCFNFVYVNCCYIELIILWFGQKNFLLFFFSVSIEEYDKLVIQIGKCIEVLVLFRLDDYLVFCCLYFECMLLYDWCGNCIGVIVYVKILILVVLCGFIVIDGIGIFIFMFFLELFILCEWDVIYLLFFGFLEKEIVEQISCFLSIVKFYKSNIFQKVGCSCIGVFKVFVW